MLLSFVFATLALAPFLTRTVDEQDAAEGPRLGTKLLVKKLESEMRVTRDVRFAEIEGVAPGLVSLDVYAPQDGKDHPIMVMIHGGGWQNGDKTNPGVFFKKARFFTRRGYVLVSVNYRLSPAVMHPVHVQDVAASIAYVHSHAAEYGGDANRIFVMGHSAGAHLAALVAVDERRLGAHRLPLSTIKGVILLDGAAYDLPKSMEVLPKRNALREMYSAAFGEDPQQWADASPITHVDKQKGIAPFLVFFTGNRVLASATGESLAAKLREAGSSARVIGTPDQDHGAINSEFGDDGDMVTRESIEFLESIRSAQRSPQQGEPGKRTKEI